MLKPEGDRRKTEPNRVFRSHRLQVRQAMWRDATFIPLLGEMRLIANSTRRTSRCQKHHRRIDWRALVAVSKHFKSTDRRQPGVRVGNSRVIEISSGKAAGEARRMSIVMPHLTTQGRTTAVLPRNTTIKRRVFVRARCPRFRPPASRDLDPRPKSLQGLVRS